MNSVTDTNSLSFVIVTCHWKKKLMFVARHDRVAKKVQPFQYEIYEPLSLSLGVLDFFCFRYDLSWHTQLPD